MTEESPFDSGLFPDQAEATAAEATWEEGGVEAARNEPVGTLQVSIDEATLGHSINSGRLQITYKMTILTGEYKDVIIRKYDGLDTNQQSSISRQQLERLGVNVKGLKLQQLPAVLLELVGKNAVVMTKKNGQYYNIYFQRLIQGEGEGGFAGTPAAEATAF